MDRPAAVVDRQARRPNDGHAWLGGETSPTARRGRWWLSWKPCPACRPGPTCSCERTGWRAMASPRLHPYQTRRRPARRPSCAPLLVGVNHVRGDGGDLLRAHLAAEGGHGALTVRNPIDDERLGQIGVPVERRTHVARSARISQGMAAAASIVGEQLPAFAELWAAAAGGCASAVLAASWAEDGWLMTTRATAAPSGASPNLANPVAMSPAPRNQPGRSCRQNRAKSRRLCTADHCRF